jgi:hypothetical protein
MTLVNLPGLFDGYDFNQMVGDVFDELDNEYKQLITLKLEAGISAENDEYRYGNAGPSTKDGRSYGDFNKLL